MMTQAKPRLRLYVTAPLRQGEEVVLSGNQSHYVGHVMRQRAGDAVLMFNGRDGEWVADIITVGKKQVTVRVAHQRREQHASPDLWLAFAPIKNKTDLVVEKATELGVSKLLPVFTRHAVVKSVNMEKLTAHAIEAAEQCERLDVPTIETCKDIPTLLTAWPRERLLLYGDESGEGAPLKKTLSALPVGKYGVVVGPEGGFSADEQKLLRTFSFVRPFTMGPRILRADTAAVAALACLQMWLGDWEATPAFKAMA